MERIYQLVIKKREDEYYSNIDYGYKYNHINIADITVSPNTFESLISGYISQIQKKENMEKKDIYISDAGIYLPSQYDTLLSKKYPSFPVYYALSRHLYNQSIHCNIQALNRLWLKIREQADHYIKCRRVIRLPFCCLIKIRYYSNYESALTDKQPMYKVGITNKYNRALIKEHEAIHGKIVNKICFVWKKHIKYDTRHFHNLIFGKKIVNGDE